MPPSGEHIATEPDQTLDCIGLYCPEPLLRAKLALRKLEPGQVLEVFADDPVAEEDLEDLARKTGDEVIFAEWEDDELRVLIRKGKG